MLSQRHLLSQLKLLFFVENLKLLLITLNLSTFNDSQMQGIVLKILGQRSDAQNNDYKANQMFPI